MESSKKNSNHSCKNCFMALLVFIACFMTMSGWAEIVTFEFEGHIDTINANENSALEGLYYYQPFTGWFSYSTDAPDEYPSRVDFGECPQDASIEVTLGPQTISYINDFVYVRVMDNDYDGEEVRRVEGVDVREEERVEMAGRCVAGDFGTFDEEQIFVFGEPLGDFI